MPRVDEGDSKEESKIGTEIRTQAKNLANTLAKSTINKALGAALGSRKDGDTVRRLYPFYLSHMNHGLTEFYDTYLSEFDVDGDENKLSWSDIHKKYETLIEGYLIEFCTNNKIDTGDLFADLSDAVAKEDRQAKVLVNMILAQSDYLVFVKEMKSRVSELKSTTAKEISSMSKGKGADESKSHK